LAGKQLNVGRSFDAYEVVGVVIPGVVVAIMLTTEWPSLRALLSDKGLSIGDFGLFVLVAFVLGHLVQAVGNLVEAVVWLPHGLPTNWVRRLRQNLVTPDQRRSLEAAVAAMEGSEQDISAMGRREWLAVTTRAYGRLSHAGRTGRIDAANRAYGLSRGLAAALLVCFAWYGIAHTHDYLALSALAAALGAAVWRMRRAGTQYARALVLDFIDLDHAGGARPRAGGA
jgi:hypothetical protein